jgi:hypothetical protein
MILVLPIPIVRFLVRGLLSCFFECDWSACIAAKLCGGSDIIHYAELQSETSHESDDPIPDFDELVENVVEIYPISAPWIIVSMGGIPNNLALKLHHANVRILGTSPESIDRAENRRKFSDLLDKLNIDQPIWKEITSVELAKELAHEHGYPVLIRPSYVLSGAAMAVASNDGTCPIFTTRQKFRRNFDRH